MVESKAEKGNRKRGKGLIDFKERKIGRVTTTQKNSGCNESDIKYVKDFYQKIINQKDPFSLIAQNDRQLQECDNKDYSIKRNGEKAVRRHDNSNVDNELKSFIIKIFAIIWIICVLILFILVANNI